MAIAFNSSPTTVYNFILPCHSGFYICGCASISDNSERNYLNPITFLRHLAHMRMILIVHCTHDSSQRCIILVQYKPGFISVVFVNERACSLSKILDIHASAANEQARLPDLEPSTNLHVKGDT